METRCGLGLPMIPRPYVTSSGTWNPKFTYGREDMANFSLWRTQLYRNRLALQRQVVLRHRIWPKCMKQRMSLGREIYTSRHAPHARGDKNHSAYHTAQYYAFSRSGDDSARSGEVPGGFPQTMANNESPIDVSEIDTLNAPWRKWILNWIATMFSAISQYNLWSIVMTCPVAGIPVTISSAWSALMFFDVTLWGAGIIVCGIVEDVAVAAVKYLHSWDGNTAGAVIVLGCSFTLLRSSLQGCCLICVWVVVDSRSCRSDSPRGG